MPDFGSARIVALGLGLVTVLAVKQSRSIATWHFEVAEFCSAVSVGENRW